MLVSQPTNEGKNKFYKSLKKNIGKNKKVFQYVFAVLICILGFIIKLFLIQAIHYPEGGFLISTGTIMLSSWYGGLGAGLLAVFINYLFSDWFFVTPGKLFFSDTLADQVRYILFIAEGILISWLMESLHRSHQKTKESLFIISQNEKLFRSLIENIKDHAIFMVDAKGNIRTWNEGAARMIGYQASEILHKSFSTLFPTDKKQVEAVNKDLRLATIKGQHNYEGWKMRKGESLFWTETTITALPAEQKFSIIIHDITARKKTDELKSEFLSIINHELRTPISIMKVIIDDLTKNFKKKDLQKENRSILDLNGEVERLILLVENILNIARLKTKKFSLVNQELELSALVENVVNKMQLIAGADRSIIFNKTRNIIVFADKVKIEQVFMNLLDNAIKFTPEKGKIKIFVKVIKKMAVVSVLNETDKVIPEDKYLLIFDKFYQLTKKPVKGLGLGLYISREIIKQHKGKISISSYAGKGNVFTFSLPMK